MNLKIRKEERDSGQALHEAQGRRCTRLRARAVRDSGQARQKLVAGAGVDRVELGLLDLARSPRTFTRMRAHLIIYAYMYGHQRQTHFGLTVAY
jgi:hypothetical protein